MARWRHIETVDGTRVYALVDRKLRNVLFKKHRAYVEGSSIYVRSQRVWERSPGLRAHELTHVRQDRQGRGKAYDAIDDAVGYYLNPLEWEAYAVGAAVATAHQVRKWWRKR